MARLPAEGAGQDDSSAYTRRPSLSNHQVESPSRRIALSDAREMQALCLPNPIEKTRYIIPAPSYEGQARCWEVDVFHGRLEGRRLAEIELGDEHEPFVRPDWLGEEVTGDPRYYNANM